MKINELIQAYISREHRPRRVGFYWASDVGSIIAGYFGPKDFFVPKVINEEGAKMMATGIACEDFLTKVFTGMDVDVTPQARKEIQISPEISLTVKVDYLFKDFSLETKFPFKAFDALPERYLYQLECEYRAFEVPVYAGLFSLPYQVKLVKFEPKQERWDRIVEVLTDFHEKIKKAESKYNQPKEIK